MPSLHVRLSRVEIAFLAAAIIAFGCFGLFLGKDTGWDFRNYHWYNAYACLYGRLHFDLAVAHHATYYNPLLDLPFYWLATKVSSGAAVFFSGTLQGLNVIPLYLLARGALALDEPKIGAALWALAGVCGTTALSLTGTTFYDNALSVGVLCALAALIVGREQLARGGMPALRIAAIGGLLIGCMAGLKLVEMFFAIGFAAALAIIPGTARVRTQRIAAGAAGGLAGLLLCGGFWFFTLAHVTGNPVFPYFNSIFQSPLALDASYRDARFLPHGVVDALLFPFRFSLDYRVADDMPFRDFRVLIAYVAIIIASIFWLLGRKAKDPVVDENAARILFVFVAVSYVIWLGVFAIYRYIVTLEMLAPILVAAAIGLLPPSKRARLLTIGALFIVMFAAGNYVPRKGAPLTDPYVQMSMPEIARPESSMILMTGKEPMAYLIPSLPAAIPVLRIDGYLAGPQDGSRLTDMMHTRVGAHRGDLFLLTANADRSAAEAAAAYGLAIDARRCQTIRTNLGGPYQFCVLTRFGAGSK